MVVIVETSNVDALKKECKHLDESQNILLRKHSEAIKNKDIDRANILMLQAQKIGSILLDLEYRIAKRKL